MKDPRSQKLAELLIQYSTKLQPGEKVLIDCIGDCSDLCKDIIEEAYKAGGIPFINVENPVLNAAILKQAPAESFTLQRKWEELRMNEMDAYIGVRATNNSYTMKSIPAKQHELQSTLLWEPVHGQIRVPKTKWVILRYPNDSMAQLAEMSTEEFEDYYFNVCTVDYKKMSESMDPLVELMEKTDKVRIVAPGTDLTFSIKGIPAIKCDGRCNIPDGEVYTAPVKDSVNGVIRYNTPSPHDGFVFKDMELTFKDGKIIKAVSNDTERCNAIFDTDDGSRYVGEFAIGVNPQIHNAMGDILFDEKIAGSIHFTPGASYDDAFNGNKSAIHWDLVLIQTPEFGGGEIWFDDVLIRKDGLFVLDELKGLNP
ncbi:MAG: aminopeptidase [Firmicutes bacterium]|nr:aminopeptidase [Bacillota bacterium]